MDRDWLKVVEWLGGAEGLQRSARATKAFQRARGVASAADLLRLVLGYCLGKHGLRSAAAWASAIGLADISNVALLHRLRQCGDWLMLLIGQVLAGAAPVPSRGRLIRLVDATSVPKAGTTAKRRNGVWRIHSAFDLPAERFGGFLLTDHHAAERLDRIAVIPGEIRIGDRSHLRPDPIAAVLAAGGDVVVRAGWKSASWLDAEGNTLDLPAMLRAAERVGRIDRPIGLARKPAPALPLRLVAVRKPEPAIADARRKVRRAAQRDGTAQVSQATLLAAEWVMVVTSLAATDYSATDVLKLYRLGWRIELAFKRLKSLVGLQGPPATDERSAKPYVLAHLLMILLLEPLVDVLEDSPRWPAAA